MLTFSLREEYHQNIALSSMARPRDQELVTPKVLVVILQILGGVVVAKQTFRGQRWRAIVCFTMK